MMLHLNRSSSSIRARCRHDLLRHPVKITIRARSAAGNKSFKAKLDRYKPPGLDSFRLPSPVSRPPAPRPPAPRPRKSEVHTPESVAEHLSSRVGRWSEDPNVRQRLIEFGIDSKDVEPLLQTFSSNMLTGRVINAIEPGRAHLERIAHDLTHSSHYSMLDRHLSRTLFEWASHPVGQEKLASVVSENTLFCISELSAAADLSCPASWYSIARQAPPRRVIMHVGPTNSGKTHNALRALAAARTGLYAGPLRLLAHEIWERLNHGQIVPLGADPDPSTEPDPNSSIDAGPSPVVRKEGEKRYARRCNMLTGEEQKIVEENGSTLLSCTVEMVPLTAEYDVAVVDEIQLIADPERGGAWTAAVLGINARELHLCGEEAAVPLIKGILRDTGDELIVNTYKRLTPLRVADESMDGDYSRLEKGDCLVTFSRRKIFSCKKRIEEKSGMRCAVAYGRLPPEIRSEQAALFNQPNSGYDILVGSDAIGMGLNLKIKRVVLETVRKFDGEREVPVPIPQIKQIAGRAGRFGMHGDDESGGIVTTMTESDLDVVRAALDTPAVPLRYARIALNAHTFTAIVHALPPDATSSTVLDVYQFVSKLHPRYDFADVTSLRPAMRFVDAIAGDMTVRDRLMLQSAPMPFRDDQALSAIRCIVSIYRSHMRVGLRDALRRSGLWAWFESAKAALEPHADQNVPLPDVLSVLESMHKIIVLYMWLSYRHSVAFPEQEYAFALRDETEQVMDRCLEALSPGEVSDAVRQRLRRNSPAYITRDELRKKRDDHFAEKISKAYKPRQPSFASGMPVRAEAGAAQ